MTALYTTNAVHIDQQMASKWMLKSRLFVCTSTCNSDLSWSRLVISTASWQFSIALKRQLVARSFNIDWTSPCSNINSSLWHAPTFAFSTNRCRKFNSKVVSNKTQQCTNCFAVFVKGVCNLTLSNPAFNRGSIKGSSLRGLKKTQKEHSKQHVNLSTWPPHKYNEYIQLK